MHRVRRLLKRVSPWTSLRETGIPEDHRALARGPTAAFGAPTSGAPGDLPSLDVRVPPRGLPRRRSRHRTPGGRCSCGSSSTAPIPRSSKSVDRHELTTWVSRPAIYSGRARMTTLQCGWKRWPEAFPQHGPGRKHERPIVLADWQQRIVRRTPRNSSAGSSTPTAVAASIASRQKLPSGRLANYAYPPTSSRTSRETSAGCSASACDRLGVRWTQSNPRNISVAHRRSVAILERVVGPKA